MITRRLNTSVLKTRDSYISKLASMGILTLGDLLLYFPRDYRDEREFTKINEMSTAEVNVVQGRVKSIFNIRTRTGKIITKAVVADDTGAVNVMWFNKKHMK